MRRQEHQESNEPPTAPQRLRRGVKNDRVFRILLCHPEGDLSKYGIAKLADAQQIQVSLLLRGLEKSHLVSGTRVTDYRGLMMRWRQLRIRQQSQSYMLQDILDALKRTELEYALTTYRAESMVNRYLFPSRTELYIRGDDFDNWHALLVGRGALVGGGNVRLRWYDDEVLYNSFLVDGYRLVTIPQLIVDLLREGGPAVEAAEMMIQKYRDLLRFNELRIRRSIQSTNAARQ